MGKTLWKRSDNKSDLICFPRKETSPELTSQHPGGAWLARFGWSEPTSQCCSPQHLIASCLQPGSTRTAGNFNKFPAPRRILLFGHIVSAPTPAASPTGHTLSTKPASPCPRRGCSQRRLSPVGRGCRYLPTAPQKLGPIPITSAPGEVTWKYMGWRQANTVFAIKMYLR